MTKPEDTKKYLTFASFSRILAKKSFFSACLFKKHLHISNKISIFANDFAYPPVTETAKGGI